MYAPNAGAQGYGPPGYSPPGYSPPGYGLPGDGLPPATNARPRRSFIGWWYRLTAPTPVPATADFDARERVRRGRLASLILLALLVVIVLALPDISLVPVLTPSIALAAVCCLGALLLNRAGHVGMAAVLLMASIDGALALALLTSKIGLDPLFLPVFYLFVASDLIVVSLLPPATIFLVASAHSIFILADVRYQPHTMMWEQMITSQGILYSLVLGPIVLEIVVAVVSFLWVRSAQIALRRADRAEELVMLERREAERTRDLEEGVQQLLAVHVAVANGNFQVIVPPMRNALLWQLGRSLATLVQRFSRLAGADYALQRTHQEAQRLAEALRQANSGRVPLWPAPSGTPLDEVVLLLASTRPALPEPGVGPNPWHGPNSAPLQPPSVTGIADPRSHVYFPDDRVPGGPLSGPSGGIDELPPWLRPAAAGELPPDEEWPDLGGTPPASTEQNGPWGR